MLLGAGVIVSLRLVRLPVRAARSSFLLLSVKHLVVKARMYKGTPIYRQVQPSMAVLGLYGRHFVRTFPLVGLMICLALRLMYNCNTNS